MRCMPRLTATQSHSNQSVCVTDTDLPSINELIPYVQVQSDIRVWCPRRPPRRLAYRTFLYVNSVTVLYNLCPRYFVKYVSL